MTIYVTEFKSPAALAEALLTDAGVTVPAHRGDGAHAIWRRERRYNIESVGEQISENTRRQIESMAMRDLCECGRLTRNALQHAAAELARDLFNDWCAETEAERAVARAEYMEDR
ncbi:MAG: hypothetical protein ACLGH6_09080 [Gammaproteobacteria bacterium]